MKLGGEGEYSRLMKEYITDIIIMLVALALLVVMFALAIWNVVDVLF